MVLGTAKALINFHNQNGFYTVSEQKFDNITMHAVVALQLNLKHIGWSYGDESLAAIVEINSRPDLIAYHNRIHQQWTRIRPDLVEHSYFQNLAP